MIDWLADNVSVLKTQHNAHREFKMSVEQHLHHRSRLGDRPVFVSGVEREACIARDNLWEMRLILPDGCTMDFAGASLDSCVNAGRMAVLNYQRTHLAA